MNQVSGTAHPGLEPTAFRFVFEVRFCDMNGRRDQLDFGPGVTRGIHNRNARTQDNARTPPQNAGLQPILNNGTIFKKFEYFKKPEFFGFCHR